MQSDMGGNQQAASGEVTARKVDAKALAEARELIRRAEGAECVLSVAANIDPDGNFRLSLTAVGNYKDGGRVGETTEVEDEKLRDRVQKALEAVLESEGEYARMQFDKSVAASREFERRHNLA